MAKVKYSTGITPIRNEHHGFTFQSSRSGATMMKSQANDRARYMNQKNKQVNILKAVRGWKQMSGANKLAWTNFATTYPQPCRKDPTKFLSGYQLFLKRNHYLFLNEGIEEPFMEAPLMNALTLTTINFSVSQMDNCADVTEAYLKNFGMLPTPGDIVLFQCLPMAVDTGQFFTPIKQQLSVTATYFDGMFLSFILPPSLEHIVFSIYLSKPINQSVNYTGTKIRYMGCFTTKTFLSLTDTPSSYTGQAGKVATVNATENALEFTTPGGGGLTCADLVNCPTIISMLATDALLLAAINYIITQLPLTAINYGYLYNGYCMLDAKGIVKAPWLLLPDSFLNILFTGTGSGGKLKEIGTAHWTTPNTGAIDLIAFNWRGSGRRETDGSYLYQNQFSYIWCKPPSGSTYIGHFASYNSANISTSTMSLKYGNALRCYRPNVVAPNGTFGVYVGNDNKRYKTIIYNNNEFICNHLAETMFNDGTLIPVETSNSNWAAATSAKRCVYGNLESNM